MSWHDARVRANERLEELREREDVLTRQWKSALRRDETVASRNLEKELQEVKDEIFILEQSV